MLLTLKPPLQNGIKGPNEYSIVRQSIPTQRSSSTSSATDSSPPPTPPKQPTERSMDSSHRGLPPPSAMTIPPESNLSTIPPAGHLMPPSPQWQSGEEPMRHWLQ